MILSIKEQLEKTGISRYQLAHDIGMTYQSVHSMYKGKSTSVKLSTLESLCKELDCNLDDILIFEDPELREKQLKRMGDTQ